MWSVAVTTATIVDLNGANPSLYSTYGIGPHYYWSNISSSGIVSFNRAQPNPFYQSQIGLSAGIRSILIAPDQNASDLGAIQLDWRLGWHQTQANGELNYTAPRIAFGASSSPQTYTFWSGNTNYTVTASTVARQVSATDGSGTKTLYDLKLEASSALPSSVMQDLLRQVGIEYRQGITPPAHDRDINLAVKISADGTNYVVAPAAQAGTLTLELEGNLPFPLHALYSGQVVVLSFGQGDLAFDDVIKTLSKSSDARLGQPRTSLFSVEVRPTGASGTVDTSFTITEVILERQALLMLNKLIPAGAQVRVRYSDPAGNQISNVVQDWRGNDALSSNGWITAIPITSGGSLTVLSGAQLGYATGDDFPYGLYVSDADGAGLQADSIVRVTAVNEVAGTYTVEVRPSILFPNPSYDPGATTGTFKSYPYSNEMVIVEVRPKAGQPIPALGTTVTFIDLFKLASEPTLRSGKFAVLASSTESIAGAVIFELESSSFPDATSMPLSLAVTGRDPSTRKHNHFFKVVHGRVP